MAARPRRSSPVRPRTATDRRARRRRRRSPSPRPHRYPAQHPPPGLPENRAPQLSRARLLLPGAHLAQTDTEPRPPRHQPCRVGRADATRLRVGRHRARPRAPDRRLHPAQGPPRFRRPTRYRAHRRHRRAPVLRPGQPLRPYRRRRPMPRQQRRHPRARPDRPLSRGRHRPRCRRTPADQHSRRCCAAPISSHSRRPTSPAAWASGCC